MNHLSNSATNMTFSNLSKNNPKKLCFQNIIIPKPPNKTSQTEHFQSLDDAYLRVQDNIKKHIQIYNTKLNEVIQTLTDLQIKDIMFFNQLLQKNKKNYEIGKAQFMEIPREHVNRINQIEKSVLKAICSPLKSFQTRTTYDSKNKRTFSQNSSSTIINRISYKGSEKVDSEKSQKIVNSRGQKKEREIESSILDTPQSVKSKISCVSRIKPQKPSNIGMFERIDICESVEEMAFEGRSVEKEIKSEYYTRQIQQDKQNVDLNKKESRRSKGYRYGPFDEE